jgi:hypothetical protein
MKSRILLILFVSGFFSRSQTLDWAWARTGNGSGDDKGMHMTRDGSGNLLLTGKFVSNTLQLSSVTLTNSGTATTSDFMLAKYDQAGSIQWAKRAVGAGDDEGMAVATDATGNIYVAGNFDSPTLVLGTITLTNSSTNGDIFVAKYDPAGNVVWARSYGGNLLDNVASLKADNSGNTYVTGSFQSLSVLFGSYGVINSGNRDGYVTKIDPGGNPLWARLIAGSQNENGLGVAVDGNGNVYVAGDFNSSNLTSYTLTNAGGYDLFLGKYDASGNLLSSKLIGGSGNESCNFIECDGSGNVYIAGTFDSPNLNLGSVTLTNGSTRDNALIKLNGALSTQWGKRFNGNQSSNVNAIFMGQSNDFYLAGTFNLASLSFGSISLSNPNSAAEAYVARFDLSGNDLWAKNTNGPGDEEARGVAVDNSGSIYMAGSFTSSLTLGGASLVSAGSTDVFLAKLCIVPGVPTVAANSTVCAKKSGTLTATFPSGSVGNWYSSASSGSLLLANSSTFTSAVSGTFYVQSANPATGCSNSTLIPVSLTVLPGASVSVSGKTLNASPGTTYKWIECGKDSVITTVTGQSYTVTKSGNYAVIVTNAFGCTDTSACKFYSVDATTGTVTVPGDTTTVPGDTTTIPGDTLHVGISKYVSVHAQLSVYPNPNEGAFIVQTDSPMNLSVINLLGERLREIHLTSENDYKVILTGFRRGIYFICGDKLSSPKRVIVTN